MKTGSIGYLTKEGFRNLKVNKLMSMASITVLFSCMFLMGFAYMVFVNIGSLVSDIESENVIMVYIEDDADSVEVVNLNTAIMEVENVESCTFVGRDEAYEAILNDMGEASDYLRGLDENPLPDAYKVTVKDMKQFDSTVAKIQILDNVMRTRENSDLAGKLSAMRNAVSYVSIGIIFLLLIVSLFIISNTIKITMFSRRLEISIMKSVGATNAFIRWPFMVEGMLLGIISGIVSLFTFWGLYEVAVRYLARVSGIFSSGSLVDIKDHLLYILAAFMIIGVFSGVFGSANSIRKYLKERKFVDLEEL